MSTWIFLLRHGATGHNLERPYRLQGNNVDVELAPVGIQQASAASALLQSVPLRAVYSSPLKRALQTAEIVSRPHALTVTAIPELREGNVGRWENRTWDEIKVQDPVAYQQFIDNPAVNGYAGGENFTQVLQRVSPILHGLIHQHAGQAIAVVGHQIVNRVLVADIMGLGMTQARVMKFANGGISLISEDAGKPILVSLNMAWPAFPVH